jgi:ATP adenylyltransferase/5',5'''-P-1,P-4-tetraphosphate phosphorylase II
VQQYLFLEIIPMKYIRISPLESQYFWMGRVFVSVDYLGAMSRLASAGKQEDDLRTERCLKNIMSFFLHFFSLMKRNEAKKNQEENKLLTRSWHF